MERVTADKRHKVINRRYIIESRNGELAEETVIADADSLGRILDEVFGVIPPGSVETLFERLESGETSR